MPIQEYGPLTSITKCIEATKKLREAWRLKPKAAVSAKSAVQNGKLPACYNLLVRQSLSSGENDTY